jgi:hypothetical protein
MALMARPMPRGQELDHSAQGVIDAPDAKKTAASGDELGVN